MISSLTKGKGTEMLELNHSFNIAKILSVYYTLNNKYYL